MSSVDETAVSGSTGDLGGGPAVPPTDLPAEDEQTVDPVEVDEAGADSDARNHFEEFVKSLPEGYCICPTCMAVGAVVEDPPFDPNTKTCPDCLGHGRVRTGAVQGPDVERDCTTCQARGWVPRDVAEYPASPARVTDVVSARPPVDSRGRTPADADFDWTAIRRDVEQPAEPAAV